MAYTLAYVASPVPPIPPREGIRTPRGPDRREHFGTEDAALRRAAEMLPGAEWLDLRLYGPDGRLMADHPTLLSQTAPLRDAVLQTALLRNEPPTG